jgi:hypothetical protein
MYKINIKNEGWQSGSSSNQAWGPEFRLQCHPPKRNTLKNE